MYEFDEGVDFRNISTNRKHSCGEGVYVTNAAEKQRLEQKQLRTLLGADK